MTNLFRLTDKLIIKCDDAQLRFFEAREKDLTFDFYDVIKPYADETRNELIEWKKLVYSFIEQKKPKNLYIQQIDHAMDAMEQFVVQSFYKATSKKRFIQSVQSTKYTLTTLKRSVEEGQSHAE